MKRCSILVLVLILSALICACTGSSVATIVEDGDTEASADGDADTNEATQDGDTDAVDGDQAEAEPETEATQDGDAESEATEAEAEPEPEAEQTDDDTTEAACASDTCAIGGTCYAAGAFDPASPCRKCDLATSRTTWTNLAFATTCNDGNACTKNDSCDGQGACKGTLDAACQADGDAEYDPDIDPDEVEIGKSCPEQGILLCLHHATVLCNAGVWKFNVNCGDSGLDCWNGNCVNPSTDESYPGCTFGELKCKHDWTQVCNRDGSWSDNVNCEAHGYKCLFGNCVSANSTN